MGIRQFKLINSVGVEYDLNDINHFFHDPSGLGYESDADFTRVGMYFVASGDVPKQLDVTGRIRFKKPNAYAKFFEFVKFCQSKPLTLVYTTNQEYRVGVNVTTLDKTEIETLGLDIGIKMSKLGMWYKKKTISNDGTTGTGKTYEDQGNSVYGYQYNYTYANDIPGVVSIDSDSAIESPCMITIYGPVELPVWRHYLNDVLMEEGSVDMVLPLGNRLIIDTTSVPYRIVETDSLGNIVTDRYQDSDFSMERFVYLGTGKNRIVVGGHGAATPAVTVEAQILYETV